MNTSVRPACYELDGPELVDVLQTNLPYRPHARFFPWLYRENPEGAALAWVATDLDSGRIVGVAAAFPRRIYCGGSEARGYILGDFCISPEYRSLGLALALQRACLAGLSAAEADFAFDFPSASMVAVYKRLRIPVNETIVRHVKPLRADEQIEKRVPVRALARGLAAAVNIGLRFREMAVRRTGDWTVAAEEGPWGEEFTEASRRWSPSSAVSVARTAGYLNWRYREHPLQRYEMLTARRGGKLGGFLVRHRNGKTCVIDDLLGEDKSACEALLREGSALARRDGVHTISAPWPSADPGKDVLQNCGFRPRESSPVVLLPFERPGRQAVAKPGAQPGAGCHLSHGDWET
jgi:hypothetical protein